MHRGSLYDAMGVRRHAGEQGRYGKGLMNGMTCGAADGVGCRGRDLRRPCRTGEPVDGLALHRGPGTGSSVRSGKGCGGLGGDGTATSAASGSVGYGRGGSSSSGPVAALAGSPL